MAEARHPQTVDQRIAGPVRPRPETAAAALTPKEVVGILRRHIPLIVSLTTLGIIAGGSSWYLLQRYAPKYTATTFIKVLPPTQTDPMTISSAQVGKDIEYGHRVSIAGRITPQSNLQKLVDRDKIQATQWFKSFGKIKARSIKKAVKDLEKNFQAYAQRDGDSVVISMTCRSDEESALIVNEMLDLFIASQGGTKKEDIAAKLTQLSGQQDRVQKELTYAEDTLNDVRKRWGFTDLEERNFRHLIDERLANLELEQNRLVLEVRQVQAIAENLERQATGPINEQVEDQIENDPIMINLAQQIALRESALAAIMTKFGENHRIVRETQKLIDEIIQKREIRKAKIAEQTRQANLKNAQDRLVVQSKSLEQLGKMLDETSAKKKDLDSARVQYDQRAAIRDERKLMLNEIKEKIEKLKIIYDDPETPKVQSVGYAPVPLEMSFPQARIFFPGGTMLGLLFGVGLAFLIELLNDLVRTPIDVSRYLHIPLLGVIPDAAEDDQLRNIQLCQVVHQAPYSMVSESYRRFRTNLKLSESAQSSKILLVTSGMPGDGKTSVAINLATTFIAEGKKVLLIDTNFRRPGLHKIFPKPQDATDAGKPEMPEQLDLGLSELLAGRCQPHQVIRSTGIEGFDIIDSGSIPPNPAELLGSIEMQQLVQQQRQSYDYVILDGPPVLLLSDAKVLARVVDGAVLIFNADATRRGAALRSIRELRQVDATIVGCVLLAVKAMKGGYFREQFKSFRQYQKLQLASPV